MNITSFWKVWKKTIILKCCTWWFWLIILTTTHGLVFMCLCVFVCVCLFVVRLLLQLCTNSIQSCYVGSAWPQLMYRWSRGCEGRGTQIRYVNVRRGAPPPGGRGYCKSSPFTAQYSWPHIFQYSEVFWIMSMRRSGREGGGWPWLRHHLVN